MIYIYLTLHEILPLSHWRPGSAHSSIKLWAFHVVSFNLSGSTPSQSKSKLYYNAV